MDQSHLHRLRTASTAARDRLRHSVAEPPTRPTTRVVLTLLVALLITALSTAHAEAGIASRTTIKHRTTKPTASTKPTVSSTTKAASATAPKPSMASKVGACELVTDAEAAVAVNSAHLVADATSSATDCVYRPNGVGSPLVLVSVRPFETKQLFVSSRSSAGSSSRAIPLAGLGDLAYRSADWSQIEFLKGKAGVLIIMNVIDANGAFAGPDQTKALTAAQVAASRA